MTSASPYISSLSVYEPPTTYYCGKVTTSGTLLDFIARTSPTYLQLVKLANMESFFNNPECNYTLFLSDFTLGISNIDPFQARKIITMSLLKGIVPVNMFTNNLILYPLNKSEQLIVHVFENTLNSDYQPNCVFKCTVPKSQNSDLYCTPKQINCNKTCLKQNSNGCTNCKTIEINESTITTGDIFVVGGLVHILNKPLTPYF